MSYNLFDFTSFFPTDLTNTIKDNPSLSLPLLKIPPNWGEEHQKSASKNLPLGLLPRDCDIHRTYSFDLQPNLTETAGPSPSLLLQAVTMSNSNDVINLGMIVLLFLLVTRIFGYIHEISRKVGFLGKLNKAFTCFCQMFGIFDDFFHSN